MVAEKLTGIFPINVMALAAARWKPNAPVNRMCMLREHILLGLLGTSAGIASAVLRKNGLNEKDVREQLQKQTFTEKFVSRA